MKKILLLILIPLLAFTFAMAQPVSEPGNETKEKVEQKQEERYATRTYTLKHITPREVEGLKAYYVQRSFNNNGRMITIVIRKDLIPRFEELLNQLDQPKRSVQLKIFTFEAMSEPGKIPDVHKDLRDVLKELSKILAFKSFQLDGTSSLMVREGQRRARILLSSKYELNFALANLILSNDKPGSRKVRFEFNLKGTDMGGGPQYLSKSKRNVDTLIASDASIEEGGYLVAGVSKLGDNGHSLVLILHCTIQ